MARVKKTNLNKPKVTIQYLGQKMKYPFVPPKRMPEGAQLITSIYRGANFWGMLEEDYYLSRVASGSHWLLWVAGIDQATDKWFYDLSGWCVKKGVPAEEAATALLGAYIKEAEEDLEGTFKDAYATCDGLLTDKEVDAELERVLSLRRSARVVQRA